MILWGLFLRLVPPPPDSTLSISGKAADAKVVGDKINLIDSQISSLKSDLDTKYFSSGTSDSITLSQLFDELRYGHGQCGSVYLTESNGLPGGWYWYIYVPHRNGGTVGDNMNYGLLMLYTFWGNSLYIARYINGTINVRLI